MAEGTETAPVSARERAWELVLAASRLAASLDREGRVRAFVFDGRSPLLSVADGAPDAVLAWRPDIGWESRVPPSDPRADLLDLYLPLCGATRSRPMVLGHLGQSLDGFIATDAGDSQFVTGPENIVHLHCLRALCDAVVVGAGTVAADDPQLTTRHVEGPQPLRVVFDPGRRLAPTYRVFTDGVAPTLYACRDELVADGETHVGLAPLCGLADEVPGGVRRALLHLLGQRGCARIFIEGGGATVSAFLEDGLLDRLHVAVAPVFIGNGRPGIRLAPRPSLRDCLRPPYRVFRMGGDVLFDCDLRADAAPSPPSSRVSRVI